MIDNVTFVELEAEEFLATLPPVPRELEQMNSHLSKLETELGWETAKGRYLANGSGYTLVMNGEKEDFCHVVLSKGVIQILVRPKWLRRVRYQLQKLPPVEMKIQLIPVPTEISW